MKKKIPYEGVGGRDKETVMNVFCIKTPSPEMKSTLFN